MESRIREVLAGREPPLLDSIRALVDVNSFTDNVEGAKRVGQMLAARLLAVKGLRVRFEPAANERFAPHLVAENDAAALTSEGCVAIVGHLDTVFPPGGFEGFLQEGPLARGPGVLDMKGGLVVAIEALRVVAELGLLAKLPVRFVIVSDEEVGSPDGAELIRREVRGAQAALVLEAGRDGDAIITARKGTGAVTAVATGKAAHAGNAHDQGANAIWALSRFVDRAQALTDYARGITVNVGKVSGGQGKNTVPDRAEALVDFRFVKVEDGEAVTLALAKAAAESAVPGTTVETTGGIARLPLERTHANVALYREYAACAKAAGLGDGESALLGGGSDASTTAAMGIPSIDGLGPRGKGFHTKEERIEIASLLPKTEAIARFLVGRASK